MPSRRLPLAAAWTGVTAAGVVAAWGFTVDPGPRWFFLAGVLPVLWAWVEFAQVRGDDAEVGAAIMTFHRYGVAFGGIWLAVQLGLKLLVHEGALDATWLGTGQRMRWLIMGGWMIVFGNLLPTLRSPWRLEDQPFAWHQVHRFVGWTLVLGGIGIFVSWAMLAPAAATRFSLVVFASAFTLALGRKLASVAAHSAGHR